MPSYVEVATVNILNGLLAADIPLRLGLNIIGGENGTLKTKLLQEIKAGEFRATGGKSDLPRIQAISPKRNSQRRAVEAIIQTMRKESRTFDTYIKDRGGVKINDATFEDYPSIGELFFLVFEDQCRDGGDRKDRMDSVTVEFNHVIEDVFPEYRLASEWDATSGSPRLRLIKRKVNEVPLEALSLGEQEVLSLIANLYASRDAYDVFLIDEPEVHLNWHLEERLFSFLDAFSDEHEKQVIVATHSRAMFKPELLPKSIFLFWNEDGRISWGSDVSAETRRRIAGEAIDIIRLGEFASLTFFVEDSAQEAVVQALSSALNANVAVSACGNSPNVRSIYKRSLADGGWPNAYFLEDGDNMGDPYPGDPRFLHLSKYCIQNYLLDFDVAATITGRSASDLRRTILGAILANKDKILGKNKFLDFLMSELEADDLTETRLAKLDASLIMPDLLRELGQTLDDYVDRYIAECIRQDKLKTVFPEPLIAAVTVSPEP